MVYAIYFLVSLWVGAEENFPYDKILRQDSYLGHRNIPNIKFDTVLFGKKITYQTNSDGYRDDEFMKKDRHYKILALGASWTFGLYLNVGERWSDLLEKELCGANVFNVSVPGYSVDQVYLLTKQQMAVRKYDLIIVQVPHISEEQLHLSQISWHPDSRKPYFKRTENKFQLVRADEEIPFSFENFNKLPTWVSWVFRGYNRLLYDYILFPKSEHLSRETLQYLFQKWIDLAESSEAEIIFLVHDEGFRKVASYLKGKYVVFDFSNSLSPYKVSRSLGHLNAEGNRLIFERILNTYFLNHPRYNACLKR